MKYIDFNISNSKNKTKLEIKEICASVESQRFSKSPMTEFDFQHKHYKKYE